MFKINLKLLKKAKTYRKYMRIFDILLIVSLCILDEIFNDMN